MICVPAIVESLQQCLSWDVRSKTCNRVEYKSFNCKLHLFELDAIGMAALKMQRGRLKKHDGRYPRRLRVNTMAANKRAKLHTSVRPRNESQFQDEGTTRFRPEMQNIRAASYKHFCLGRKRKQSTTITDLRHEDVTWQVSIGSS